MARKFMKIRGIAIPFMTLVILTSQLAGCATSNGQEMIEEPQQTPEAAVEDSQLAPDQQDLDNQQEKKELSGNALIRYFQLTYDSSVVAKCESLDEQIDFELEMLASFCDTDGVRLPADYADQYREWRPVDNQQEQTQAPEAAMTFTEVDEQVWATGTVNLRNGPSTEDEKVGALNEGNSVTRIGIGMGDYASWSKVKLNDGNEVYVASDYLSTTKPTTESHNSGQQGGGNNQNNIQQSNQQQNQSGNQSQDTYDSDTFLWTDPYAGMTPEEKAAQMEKDGQATQRALDETTGTMHD